MKIGIIFSSILFLASIIFIVCQKSEESISGPINNHNLIINSSFETEGNPTLGDWLTDDINRVEFSNDSPEDGGKWSIALEADWSPSPPSLFTLKKLVKGNHKYNFSFWAKCEGIGGYGYLSLKNLDTLIIKKYIQVVDTTWIIYSIIDTISSNEYDSIELKLSGGFSHLLYGKTYFDLCKLEILD